MKRSIRLVKKKMLGHIERTRRIHCERREPGIYGLTGDMFPMQVLITKELSKEENYWLQSLRNNLKAGAEIQELLERYEKKKDKAYYPELMNLIVRANWEQMKEEKQVCEALRELFADKLRESEEKGMESGLKQGPQNVLELAKTIFRLFRAGVSPKRIEEECGVSVEQVKDILE